MTKGTTAPPTPDEAPDRDRQPRWGVAAAATLAFLIAGNIAQARLSGIALLCMPASGCGTIHSTRYATFLGWPTAVWGMALYAAIAGLALRGLPAGRWLAAFVLSVIAVTGSTLLVSVSLSVVGVVCVYCFGAAAVAAVVLGIVFLDRPRAPARPLLEPRSLALLATLALLGTVTAFVVVLGLR